MKSIFGTFKNRVLQLTFRLLPTQGVTPWMVGAAPQVDSEQPKHQNKLLEKMVSKPWFGNQETKSAVEDALDEVVATMIGQDEEDFENEVLEELESFTDDD